MTELNVLNVLFNQIDNTILLDDVENRRELVYILNNILYSKLSLLIID